MYIQDLFVAYNDYRPFNNELLNKLIGNSSKMLGRIGQRILPCWFKRMPGVLLPEEKRATIIVTMTSFPARIASIWIVFESLLRQRLQPKQIWLYLSEEQFPEHKLPISLNKYLNNNFLKIIWTKQDIKSYKKFWYFIKDYPNESFITLDDDIIYHSNIVRCLVEGHKNSPGYVLACYCYKIKHNSDGSLKPYKLWDKKTIKGDCGLNIFFGSGGGTFFPAGCLKGADTDFDVINKICPLADDIWLNIFVRLNGFQVLCVRDRRWSLVSVPIEKNISLSSQNLKKDKNDEQLKAVMEYFRIKL